MGQMGMGQMSQMGHSSQWSQSDAASGMGGSFTQGHPTVRSCLRINPWQNPLGKQLANSLP